MDLELGPKEFPPDTHLFFRSPEDVYATALVFLAERFQHLLEEEGDVGLMVVDSRFREDDMRLRRFFGELTEGERRTRSSGGSSRASSSAPATTRSASSVPSWSSRRRPPPSAASARAAAT